MKGFDRFASRVADKVAAPWFFIACVLLVVLWVPSYVLMPSQVPGKVDTWQLVINTATTIITFLLVALLHNDQQRFEKATNARLQTVLDALGDLLSAPVEDPVEDEEQKSG